MAHARKRKSMRKKTKGRSRSRKYRTRSRKIKGGGPVMESCGSGKCSMNGTTVVTYRGSDPVDSVPTFVSMEEADKMYENDQY